MMGGRSQAQASARKYNSDFTQWVRVVQIQLELVSTKDLPFLVFAGNILIRVGGIISVRRI